jgi:hypothetical protein
MQRKQQQKQQQKQVQQRQPSGNGPSGNAKPGGAAAEASGSSSGGAAKLGSGMNYFAALSGALDADALQEELFAEEEQRRQSGAASNGVAHAADDGRSRHGDAEGGGLKQPLVWIDLEMTGLEVDKDQILQIAVICTGQPTEGI